MILYNGIPESDNGYFNHCLEYYFSNIKCIDINELDTEHLGEEISKSDGIIWFLDTGSSTSENSLLMEDIEMKDFGNYGFNSLMFEIYQIE